MKTTTLIKPILFIGWIFCHLSAFGQTVLHVDDDAGTGATGSRLAPFQSIQSAVQTAVGGDTLKVATGTYVENILIQDKSLVLLGGFSDDFSTRNPDALVSHINGDGTDATITLLESGAAIVNGFRITGGTRSQFGLPYYNLGGGFFCQGGSPTISDNIIEDNDSRHSALPVSETSGGGIYAEDSDVTIRNNIIRNNASGAGAGIAVFNGTIIIESNLVENNIGYNDHGGGLYISCPNATITRNTIRNNEIGRDLGYGWGGGVIFFGLNAKAELSFNKISGNLAPTAGSVTFIDDGAEAILANELIYANRCSEIGGAGIYVDGEGEENPGEAGSRVAITNCTVSHNEICTGDETGNGLLIERNSTVTISNSIFWGNGDDFSIDPTSTLTMTYSNSAELLNGEGNQSTNPLFVNPGTGDFHLSSNAGRWETNSQTWVMDAVSSPCIDAGDPDSDFNLEQTPNGSRSNLGAYGNTAEASKSTATTRVRQTSSIDGFELHQNYPNPFNPTTTISFSIAKSAKVNLALYDLLGRQVATLVKGKLTSGEHTVIFDGKDLASGVYFYRLIATDVDNKKYILTQKLTLLK